MKKKEQRFIKSRLPARNKEALFSHKSDIWKTPKTIYEGYMKLGFFDPCPVNPTFDGLEIEWKRKNFVNPPYSQIKKWVDKAIEETKKGKIVTLLIPARTDTKWFKKLYLNGAHFSFITGRLHFNDEKNAAPFPSMFVTPFRDNTNSTMIILDHPGHR